MQTSCMSQGFENMACHPPLHGESRPRVEMKSTTGLQSQLNVLLRKLNIIPRISSNLACRVVEHKITNTEFTVSNARLLSVPCITEKECRVSLKEVIELRQHGDKWAAEW